MTEDRPLNRQALRSRRMLQDALLALLREKPYQKISVTEIARRADLARPTFYAHFETKDDLLMSYVDDVFEQFLDELYEGSRALLTSDESVDLQLNIRLFEVWQDNAEVLRLIRTADVDNLILARLKAYYRKRYRASHSWRDTVAPEILQLNPALADYFIDFIAGTTFMLLMRWMDEKMRHSPEVMGKLLYHLTGPERLKDVIEKFGDIVT
jgi:AcrR family transcriptional regulator